MISLGGRKDPAHRDYAGDTDDEQTPVADRDYDVKFLTSPYALSSSASGRNRARTPTRATVPGWTRAGGRVALAAS